MNEGLSQEEIAQMVQLDPDTRALEESLHGVVDPGGDTATYAALVEAING